MLPSPLLATLVLAQAKAPSAAFGRPTTDARSYPEIFCYPEIFSEQKRCYVIYLE